MRIFSFLLPAVFLALMLNAQAAPGQEHQHEPQNSGTKPTERNSMAMMKDCMQRHQAALASVDQMMSMMESAKESDDPAKMRTAMDQSQKQLRELKEHMTLCRNMMSMMEKMHEQGGMMKGETK